jgi:hypothetical protein
MRETGFSMRIRPLQTLSVCVSALALLAAATGGHAADAPFSIQQHENPQASDWSLAINGQWPTRCPPTLETVALQDHDLRIDARSVLELCERGATAFSIELNPKLAVHDGSMTPGVYRVSFYAADGAQATPKLRAFTLLDRSLTDAPSIIPETGFWWTSSVDENANRTTLSLELQDGQLSVALLSYDEIGRAAWYFGAAAYAGRIAHLPLLRLAGGAGPFVQTTTAPHGESTLALDLEFSSAAHASAWLSRAGADDNSLQLQPLDLVRLPLADSSDGHAWQGDWVLLTDAADAIPMRLHLDQFHATDAAHFQLTDAILDVVLVCARNPAQPDWPPLSCLLRQGENTSLGHFSSVALTRMDGRRDAAPVHLLRVTP